MATGVGATLPGDARCRKCRYHLAGLPGPTCPECGTGFDPGDPSTYRVDNGVARWRSWARPPSRRLSWIAFVATLIYLVGESNPAGVFGLVITGEPFLPGLFALSICIGVPIVIGVEFAIRAVSSLGNVVLPPEEPVSTGGHGRLSVRWFVAPTCALIAASAIWTSWPLSVRFGASRAAFEANAITVLAAASKPANPLSYFGEHFAANRWIGWYYVRQINVDAVSGTIEFIIDGSSMAWWGFYLDPAGRIAFSRKPIVPSWYPYFYVK